SPFRSLCTFLLLFHDPAPTAISTLSLHDALPILQPVPGKPDADDPIARVSSRPDFLVLGYPWIGAISSDTSHLSYCKLYNVMDRDRKSTRLNSSHVKISYAVFCLKKKKKKKEKSI